MSGLGPQIGLVVVLILLNDGWVIEAVDVDDRAITRVRLQPAGATRTDT